MSLASVCVRRPVTASMFYLGIFLLGAVSWVMTPRELFPSISFPQLLVITRYGNAAPEEIENLITKVIEESVGTVPNLKRVKSLSKEGSSLVTLEFDWGTDMGFAHLSAREKIDQIKDRLPSEAEEPIINRINPFAQPMMIFSVSGDMHMARLTEVTRKVVKQRLEKVAGVASAAISGGLEREIQVMVDRGRMEVSNVSLSQIVDALKDTNLNYPGGTVQGKFYEYLLRTMGEFKNISEIGRTVVKVDKPQDQAMPEEGRRRARRVSEVRSERLLHLEDLSEVVDAFKDQTSYSRYDGRDNISISIQKQADANTITTAERVRAAVDELEVSLPRGMRLDLVYDESVFIKQAVGGVTQDGVTGGVLAFLVLYYFLKSFSMALIVALAIPASTLITFTGMFFNDISINMLSLAGLGLGIGNMVDNSIVVAENIARHRIELGKSQADAAIDGTEEVSASMVTSSLTNVAVLLPLLFAKGVAQLIFKDMFFIVTCASFASVFISITLVPLLTGHPLPIADAWDKFRRRVLKRPEVIPAEKEAVGAEAPGRFKRLFTAFTAGLSDEALQRLIDRYQHALAWTLTHPRKTWMIVAASLAVSFFLLAVQDKVFMPKFDQGQFILKIQMPVGTRLEVTDRVTRSVERVLKSLPAVKDANVNVGSTNVESVSALGAHQAQVLVNVDRGLLSSEEVIVQLRAALEKENLEGAEVQYILQDSVLSSVFETSSPIVVEVKGPDLITLRKLSEDIMRDLESIQGVYGVKSSMALPSAETRVEIDKVRAAAYGLSVAEIARTALIGVKGFVATTYKEGGEEVDVRVQLRHEDRADVAAIRHLAIRAPNGLMVPMSDVAELHTARGPSEIKHLDQQRSVVVGANVQGRPTSDAIADAAEKLVPFQGLADYQVILSGESAQMKESFGGLVVAMALAVLLIYMIMAAEFESLWNPLIIMVTIPLSLVGVALSLFLTFTPLSAPVFLGTILLAGSVVNYGIVLIDFMKQLKEEGHDLWTVVIHGSSTRLRPVLMSSLTTILAVLPLALGLSEGSELSSPMAVVTFGGLGVSVLLSLFIIPLLYYASEEYLARRGGK